MIIELMYQVFVVTHKVSDVCRQFTFTILFVCNQKINFSYMFYFYFITCNMKHIISYFIFHLLYRRYLTLARYMAFIVDILIALFHFHFLLQKHRILVQIFIILSMLLEKCSAKSQHANFLIMLRFRVILELYLAFHKFLYFDFYNLKNTWFHCLKKDIELYLNLMLTKSTRGADTHLFSNM